MADKAEVVGLIGGELISSAEGSGAREIVLALPLDRLLVRMVRVPASAEADASAATQPDFAAFLTPLLQEMSPYPDEELTVGWEVVSQSERGTVVLAAALPESSADDVAEILDQKKLRVTRLDALVLGELRALWPSLAPNGDLGAARRLLLLDSDMGASEDRRTTEEGASEDRRTTEEGASEDAESPVLRVSSRAAISMIVLDGDVPSAIRSIPAGADLRREAMMCLLEAEDFGGAKPLAEIVTVGAVDASVLSPFGPIRSVTPVSIQDSLDALVARAADPNGLDARPASWREYLEETRFKAKVCRGVAAAVGVWLVAMGVLFGVPMAYGYMTDYQKGLSKQHQKQHKTVTGMKAKVELVRKYSDHARGALEMVKAVSDRLPEGVELDSLDFKREDGVSFSGMADDPKDVYELKDALTALADADENRVFGTVRLGRLTSGKGNKQKFTLDCRYQTEEEEE